MVSKQLVEPRLGTVDGAGWCHRFARNFFGAPMGYSSAWEAWQATEYKHGPGEALPDVAVLLWFSHYGTYGSPPTYGNWGHVAVHVPGRGIYTSPGYGEGQEVWQTIAQIESRFASTYVGWSEDINGLRVAQVNADVPEEDSMIKLYLYTPTNSLLLVDHLNMTIRNLGNKATPERDKFDKMPFISIADPEWGQMAGGFRYITAPNVATDGIDITALGAKIAADLASLGVQGDAVQIAAAVERVLADDFAAIPGAVADVQAERLKS